MALENLKSVFANGVGNNTPQIGGRHGKTSHPEGHSALDNIKGILRTPDKPTANTNSFGPTPDKPTANTNLFGPTPDKPTTNTTFFGPTPDKPTANTNSLGPTGDKPTPELGINSQLGGRHSIAFHPGSHSSLDEFVGMSPTPNKTTAIYNSLTNTNLLNLITTTNSENAFPSNYTAQNTIINNEFNNGDVLGKHSWTDLYHSNHTSISINHPSPRSNNPFQPSNSPNSGNLSIKVDGRIGILGIAGRTEFLGLGQGEPYIVSNLPTKDKSFFGTGRFTNMGSRNLPFARATTDTIRIGKYLTSPNGLLNIALKNADLIIPQTVVRKGDDLIRVPQRFNNGYNPLATLLAVSPLARLIGHGPHTLAKSGLTGKYASLGEDSPTPGFSTDGLTDAIALGDKPEYKINSTFTQAVTDEESEGLFSLKNLGKFFKTGGSVKKTSSGDKMTLARMISGKSLSSAGAGTMVMEDETNVAGSISVNIEKKEEGMPFYFKDLRDNKYIFFRAYLDGITENISPSWSETTFIGRSEPAYVYEKASRTISFNLTLFAHTSTELEKIYAKMNKLTSLCYPEYAKDDFLSSNLSTKDRTVTKTRMKPPLMKMRLGDLFGSKKGGGSGAAVGSEGMLGFLESLSYTIPESSTWETENGKKVPKYITVSISYKVIHGEAPNMDTQFYGYKGVN